MFIYIYIDTHRTRCTGSPTYILRTCSDTVELVVPVTARPLGTDGGGGVPDVLATTEDDGGDVPPEVAWAMTCT